MKIDKSAPLAAFLATIAMAVPTSPTTGGSAEPNIEGRGYARAPVESGKPNVDTYALRSDWKRDTDEASPVEARGYARVPVESGKPNVDTYALRSDWKRDTDEASPVEARGYARVPVESGKPNVDTYALRSD